MPILRVGDIHTRVISKDHRTLAVVRRVCRARPAGYEHMPKYRAGYWDGFVSLMGGLTTFPTGLISLVIPQLEAVGYSVEIEDTRKHQTHVDISKDCLHGVTLRDYQLRAIEALLQSKNGVAKMATNAGKTEVMAAILSAFGPGTEALVVLHRKELMYQTAERFRTRLGENYHVGIFGDGKRDPGTITIAMVQTLSNMALHENLAYAHNHILMVDEAHHASSNQMMDVLLSIPGPYRFGFSGTPLKYDMLADLKLIALTGEIVVDISNKELIEAGYSAEPMVYLHIVEEPDGWGADYQDAYRVCVADNEGRNALIADLAQSHKGIVLILVNILRQGAALRSAIPGSVFVHGSDSTEYRMKVLGDMRSGVEGIYIASPIFGEGVDVPAIDVLILAAGGKSHISLLQRIGRGLRIRDDKKSLIVHDFLDDTNEYLLDHSEARMDIYEQEGFDVELCTDTNIG